MSYQILVLSDLHLGEKSNDLRYKTFLDVLEKFSQSTLSELLFMGDIFDILIGSKELWRNIHPEFFKLLEDIRDKGKKITWVQGNHDFQLESFLKPFGVHWITNFEIIQRESLRIFLSHGDLADKTNKLHPLWRAFHNSIFMTIFIFLLPSKLAEKTLYPWAMKWSRSSRKKAAPGPQHTERTKSLFRKYAQTLQKKHHADLVILGHSHISDDAPLPPASRYLNFGSWYEEAPLGLLEIQGQTLQVKVYTASAWLLTPTK